MASGNLRVDSLFLDEGFGTLDNDALDRAIGTLNQLHQSQGKLIGVISHIDQLKNQISTKIEVTKIGNGRSKLSGTGVERLVLKEEQSADTAEEKTKKKGRTTKVQ
jgi:exonuclease SbcC